MCNRYFVLIGATPFNDLVVEYTTKPGYPESLDTAIANALEQWFSEGADGATVQSTYWSIMPIYTHPEANG